LKEQAMKLLIKPLVPLLILLGAAAIAGADENRAEQGQQESEPSNLVLFVPHPHRSVADDTDLGKGCWAMLYGRTGFRGDQLTIIGPITVRHLDGVMPGGAPDSLVVGPKAQVIVFDQDSFKGQSAQLSPKQRLADLTNGVPGELRTMESLRVSCTS
jgi:hypothetical protein